MTDERPSHAPKPEHASSLTLPSPAKLNLFLHINGQRSDGYHNLQTVFQLLDYGDTVTLTPQPHTICLEPNLPGVEEKDNLAYRAAAALKTAALKNEPLNDPTHPHQTIRHQEQQHNSEHGQLDTTNPIQAWGAKISIQKVLPMGGGIGGGSSNAATVLLGLNHLWKAGFTIDQLAAIGRDLGADVPVFVRGQSAWAEGIGEQLTPISLPDKWFVVIAPACSISTAQIFSHKHLTRSTRIIKVAAFLKGGGRNDCQPLVEQLYPPVKDAVDWLNQYSPAQLTGTGACIFSSFSTESEAREVLAKKPEQWDGFVAHSVNESPLHHCLQAINDVTGV